MTTAEPWAMALANSGLAVAVSRRYRGRGLDFDDLLQEGLIGLRKAALRYDPGRGPFGAWARMYALSEMRLAVARGGRWAQRREDDDRGEFAEIATAGTTLEPDERERLLAAIGRLSPRQQFVIRRRYGLDGPAALQKEIARDLGVTTTRVCQIEKQAMARLRIDLGEDAE